MAGTNILPGKFFRSLPFQSWTETRNTHKKLSEFAVQKKVQCRSRLVSSIFNQQEDNVNDRKDDNVNDSKDAIHFNESYDRASGEIGFEAIAAIGRVECTGLGCRPIIPDNVLSAAMLHDGWLPYEHAMEALNARIQSYNGMKMNPRGHFHGDFARYLYRVWMQKALAEKYYEQALEMEPCNPQLLVEYAEFVWNLMGDEEKAEKVFNAALQEDPDDPIIRGSYALFMHDFWRLHVSHRLGKGDHTLSCDGTITYPGGGIWLKQSFNHITFTHVYRERNGLDDQLSKEATQQDLALGTWRITIHSSEGTFSYYHRPFHDDIEAQH